MSELSSELPFTADQREILTHLRSIALALGIKIYLVGGVIRDHLLGKRSAPTDIDLVCVGGSAPEVIRSLRSFYPRFQATEHEKFHTAELTCPEFTIDLASARCEVYAYPGANPQVELCDLKTDLYRRDFTVNALAVELLDRAETGPIIDLYNGLGDLAQRQLRPIRLGSFAEDPRRIFRAVRFAIKCSLQLHPELRGEIIDLCASGLHDDLGGWRLKAELTYILQMGNYGFIRAILAVLEELGALRLIDRGWQISPRFSLELRRLDRWYRWFAPDQLKLPPLRLELLLRNLDTTALDQLTLSPTQIRRIETVNKLLHGLASSESPVKKFNHKSNRYRPSQIVDRFQNEDIFALILAGAITADPSLWQYFTKLRKIRPLLTGTELTELGYPRGKILGQLLNRLHQATLDGEIANKTEAIDLLAVYWQEIQPNRPLNPVAQTI